MYTLYSQRQASSNRRLLKISKKNKEKEARMLRKTTKTRKHLYIYIFIYQEHSLRRFLLFHSLSWIDWIPVAGYMLSQGYPPYVIMYIAQHINTKFIQYVRFTSKCISKAILSLDIRVACIYVLALLY